MSLLRYDRRVLPGHNGLIGVDEAGRGALAGPVVAAAVWLTAEFYANRPRQREGRGLNDSKQLTAPQRDEFFAVIESWRTAGLAYVTIAAVGVREIAVHNIFGATRLAMGECLHLLQKQHGNLPAAATDLPLFSTSAPPSSTPAPPRILIDGRPLRPFGWPHEGVIDGDARCFAIAAASIVAKVTRDRLMTELETQCPGYGLARHKGYGTAEHQAALLRLGPSPWHRPLFLRKFNERNFPAATQAEWALAQASAAVPTA